VGRAGDEGLFPGAKGLLQRDGSLGLEHAEGARLVDEAVGHDIPHAPPQNILRGQTGYGLIGVVDENGDGISVGDVQSVVKAVQDRQKLVVDFALTAL
jgi:hypothetical protein